MGRKSIKDRPLERYRSPVVRDQVGTVVENGGRYGAGMIRGASAITLGPALGHDQWIDATFLEQVAESINAAGEAGVKMRFTHPDVSSDGMGKYLGRGVGARVEGSSVLLEAIHFSKSATKSPDGNLVEYVTSLAQESPDSFGISIVFAHDAAAEDMHYKAHAIDGEYRSPDPANVDNLPHVRLKMLYAADVVDDPAANPRGLFHRQHALAEEAVAMANYVLGITPTIPHTIALGLDAERTRAFVSRFLADHKLELREVNDMGIKQNKARFATAEVEAPEEVVIVAADPEPVDDETDPDDEGTKPAADVPAEPEPETEPVGQLGIKAQGTKFLAAFGDQGGVWFAQGMTFEEANVEYLKQVRAENAALKTEVDELKTRLKAGRRVFASVDEGTGFQPSGDRPARVSLEQAVRIAGRG